MIKLLRIHHLVKFSIINFFIVIFLSYNYTKYLSVNTFNFSDWFYLFVAIIGQYFLLILIIFTILIPFLLINKTTLRNIIISLLSTSFIMLLISDILIFERYRFHLNLMLFEFYLAGQLIELPTIVYLQLLIVLSGVFFLEYFLLYYISKKNVLFRKNHLIYLATFLVFCLFSSHIMHIWADQYMSSNITRVTKYIPAYYPSTARNLLLKLGIVNDDLIIRKEKLKVSENSNLNYPLNEISYNEINSKYDIIIIVIDSWRYDAFNKDITPNISNFSKKGLVFDNHKSTGNATRSGLFGMFYGIPATYWRSFLGESRSPILIDRLQELNYKFGIYSSAQLIRPEFNQTIFSQIENLRQRSNSQTVEDRDIEITNEWVEWYRNLKNNDPSFSFLFYDAAHAYAVPKNYSKKFEPFTEKLNHLQFDEGYDRSPLFNRYKTSVHFVDSLIGNVINEIKIQGKLDKSVIIITSDHGEEFNDNRDNFWGHNSNFTDIQIKVPFIFLSPSDSIIDKRWLIDKPLSTHEDISPTILKNFLGSKNETIDYSTGRNLLDSVYYRDWSIVNSYHTYAIVYDEMIIEFYPSGVFEIFDKKNKKINKKIDFEKISLALEDMSLFNK